MQLNLKAKLWWDYLEEDIKELLEESLYLHEKVASWRTGFHDYAFVPSDLANFPPWPLNLRVGANSPNLCPTIFSVINTGT